MEKKTKGFNIITYLGPAVIVGQFSLVQNSVRVPQSKFTWLKKSTAEIGGKKKKPHFRFESQAKAVVKQKLIWKCLFTFKHLLNY